MKLSPKGKTIRIICLENTQDKSSLSKNDQNEETKQTQVGFLGGKTINAGESKQFFTPYRNKLSQAEFVKTQTPS